MDRQAREREQASLALSALAAAGLQEKQLSFAFEELLLNLEVGQPPLRPLAVHMHHAYTGSPMTGCTSTGKIAVCCSFH